MTAKTYNGHKSWNHWNVSLWLNNDQTLYNIIQNQAELAAYLKISHEQALAYALPALPDTTPDGARITAETVRPVLAEAIRYQIEYS